MTTMIQWFIFFLLGVAAFASNMFAAPVTLEDAPWWIAILRDLIEIFPSYSAWLIVILGGLTLIFTGLAKIFEFIHSKTATKTDDKIYEILTKILYWLTKISGWLGGGTPKLILEEEKKK